jgi:hypothetical protein
MRGIADVFGGAVNAASGAPDFFNLFQGSALRDSPDRCIVMIDWQI